MIMLKQCFHFCSWNFGMSSKKDLETRKVVSDEKGNVKSRDIKEEDKKTSSMERRASVDLVTISHDNKDQTSILTLITCNGHSDIDPIRGDLVKFEWNREQVFGYVEEDETLQTYEHLGLSGKFKIKTRRLKHFSLKRNFLVTTVLSVSPYLRFVKAMQDLPRSCLFDTVMKPRVEDYEIADALRTSVFPLITGHVLNHKQMDIVARVVATATEQAPKICLIQGPPGTGKSKVILNIICEILNKKSTKILLCAPSNRAIDELVGNFLTVQKANKNLKHFSIVRVGCIDKMGDEVQEVTLPHLAQMSELKSEKRKSKDDILRTSDVIATTLSSSYSFQMERIFENDDIPVCIVDEAAQSTELGTLIPLMLGVRTLILVGDPKQLPPTVLSPQAKFHGFDKSLFYRAKENFDLQQGNPILMLDTQYRMVEDIVSWPNNFFYQGRLKTGSSVPSLPFHNYKLLHHSSHQNQTDFNHGEAQLVVNLIMGLSMEIVKNPANEDVSIGIITPYRRQREVILNLLKFRCKRYAPAIKIVTIPKPKDLDNNFDGKKAPKEGINNSNTVQIPDGSDFEDWEELLLAESQEEEAGVQKEALKGRRGRKSERKIEEKTGKERIIIEGEEELNSLCSALKSVQLQDTRKKDKNEEELEKPNDGKSHEKIEGQEEEERIVVQGEDELNSVSSRLKVLSVQPIPNKTQKEASKRRNFQKTKRMEKEAEVMEYITIEVMEKPSPLYLKLKSIQVNTVDSFQGQERDIIVMSCVRSKGIGFVNDPNRLCVSLTRAKHTMLLCGNFGTFKKNAMWKALLRDATSRNASVEINANASIANIMKHVIAEKSQDDKDIFLW
uniref:DDB_G0274399 protein n=1 Tax=Fopius arisanus TaxID=64838 RepID=A0A0C9QDY4_9HYME